MTVFKWAGLCFLFLSLLLIIISACETPEQKERRISKVYCGSCHLFPEPSLLDKKTWENSVLPEMAFRMGSITDMNVISKIAEEDLRVVLGSLPRKFIATDEHWEIIKHYYLTNAPDSLALDRSRITDSLRGFDPIQVRKPKSPFLTAMYFDSESQKTYLGTRMGSMFQLDASLNLTDSLVLGNPISHIGRFGDDLMVTLMGIMDPNDQSKGAVTIVHDDNGRVLIDSIQRPVFTEAVDLNDDGQRDVVVCGFGNFTGHLSIYDISGEETVEYRIGTTPGARNVIVRDFNHDGRPDIMALFSQGDERVILYTNEGDFHFDEEILLRFSPVQGTSFLEVADMNGDGHPDIIVTQGDNADYSMVVKPYHGVRVFENDGDFEFSEKWFYHMPGASMVRARDFDRDGDFDLAAISFFPDLERTPEKSFIYFENRGHYSFSPSTTVVARNARWLIMDAFDYDSDGDDDIFLGANNFRPGVNANEHARWMSDPFPLIVLKNQH